MWQKSGLYFKQVQGEVGKNEEEKWVWWHINLDWK
jgi:hypothetical protein